MDEGGLNNEEVICYYRYLGFYFFYQETMKNNYKNLTELKKGKFIIVTENGYYHSYYDIDIPIFSMVPNSEVIIGFIQEDT